MGNILLKKFTDCNVQLQSSVLHLDLLHSVGDDGPLLSTDGQEVVGTETNWRGHSKPGKM